GIPSSFAKLSETILASTPLYDRQLSTYSFSVSVVGKQRKAEKCITSHEGVCCGNDILVAPRHCRGNELYTVELYASICDAPARAYFRCIKEYNACYRCEIFSQKGKYDGRKVSLQNKDAPLHIDDEFRDQVNEDYYHGVSPLSALDVGLVSVFTLDYMHLVWSAVIKRG
ncbi:hypothetical protein IscW_ISCW015692, partial [Ixodes scapularis]